MSLNPLNELKRRLDDNSTPLPKRLCLAKNVINSHHFPTAPKERVVADWLNSLTDDNKLAGDQLKGVLDWLTVVDDLTSELKYKLIEIVSQYVQKNPLEVTDIRYILEFIENPKISTQLSSQADNYLTITITLLQLLHNNINNSNLSQRILNNFIKYYRESKKKLDFIIKLLNGEHLETVFSYLNSECRETVLNVCQNILFPVNKRSFFISFLQTLIRKDNLEELIAEKGDNIQSVIKIMNTFFEYPKNRSQNNTKFLHDFIDVFVSCFRNESQVIFAFYIMVANVLNMEQNFIIPAMTLDKIIEDDPKIKRILFYNMLQVLLHNEIDVNIRLTDTFGEKISKVEIKKNFITFLQVVMMGQLKLEGRPDKTTLQIIKTALKLDPGLIEKKIDIILPPIMAAKKNSSNLESYTEMLNCLLEILFKLSRGTLFINQILPSVKNILEACNTEQFELKQKINESFKNGIDCVKIESKVITGVDVLPQECVNLYGRLTSELMFRQNKELLELLQKDLEEHCLMMLEEGFVSPSIITLTEVLSAILASFLQYNKMADHTVPMNIAEDFWNTYKRFEEESLGKFGECILKLSFNLPLVISFLKLCVSFAQLKLLKIKYSHTKLDLSQDLETSDVFDLSILLPCLSSVQWTALASKIVDEEAVVLLDNLLLANVMAIQLLTIKNKPDDSNQSLTPTKTHLVKQIIANPNLLQNNYICRTLFADLNKSQTKTLAKCLVKLYLDSPELDVLNIDAVANNRVLLNSLVLETAKNIAKCFENADTFSKALSKSDFNMVSFSKEVDITKLFKEISLKLDAQDVIKKCVDILKQLQLHYLEENYQLLVIFLILAIKKSIHVKKVKRNTDFILQSIYEISIQQPDLYQIFSVNFIFDFKDKVLLNLLTLNKFSNSFLIIRSVLELAVKKVRADSDLVKNIVESIQDTGNTTMESFSDAKFQITCLILPLIVKQKKAITASAYRSILADLQEKLHTKLLDSFKNINFSSILINDTGKTDDSMVEFESNMGMLNAMAAHSLTMAKYCESNDSDEIKNLECLWSGLECFIQIAINTISNVESKPTHIESSIQYLNVILRYIKKLESHSVFQEKDKLFLQIWRSIKTRLLLLYSNDSKCKLNINCMEDIGVTLKFLCELTSVGCFGTNFVGDLTNLVVLKKPSLIIKDDTNSDVTSKKVFKYMYLQCLKANIVGPKCVAISKLMYRICKNLRFWIRQHYEPDVSVVRYNSEVSTENGKNMKVVEVDDVICELLRLDLDSLSELLLAAKKISLDYKFLDTIFELQHLIHYILGAKSHGICEISWPSFFRLYEGCVAVLNTLLLSREEILEDRWPCYMQCYRALISSLCERSTSNAVLDKQDEEKLAEIAHSIEKLTQSISKRKKHVSRIAAYTVADICTSLERTAPSRIVRQHLENSVAMLIQASDNSYAMAFLKRALVGTAGQMTMTNLYTMYKRYHKYVGNA